MVETLSRRELAKQKLREGWDRLALEQPDIDFSLDSLAVLEAEIKVSEAVKLYEEGGRLSDVKDAFNVWANIYPRRKVSLFD